MRKLLLAGLFALACSPSWGQQQQPLEQRIASQIGNLSIQNASLAIQVEQLQAALGTAQMRVKALEDKYEPKTPPPQTPDVPVAPKE